MIEILQRYLPEAAVEPCFELIKTHGIFLKIVDQRKTRHGDYKTMPDGKHRITINSGNNKYKFLITLIHEISHAAAYKKYGDIKPHGKEWKQTFQELMSGFLVPTVFPEALLPTLLSHFSNPMASDDADEYLRNALRAYDLPKGSICLLEQIQEGGRFKMGNGKVFIKGVKRFKLCACVDESNHRLYWFRLSAKVQPM